ncbi:hypothetical protein ACW95P_02785 [Candidatus Mycoplasma pogonae]
MKKNKKVKLLIPMMLITSITIVSSCISNSDVTLPKKTEPILDDKKPKDELDNSKNNGFKQEEKNSKELSKEKPKEPNLNNSENKNPTENQLFPNKPKKVTEAVQNPENKNSEINNSENSRDSAVNSPKIKPSEEIKKSENSSKVNDNDEENELKNTEIIENTAPKQEEKKLPSYIPDQEKNSKDLSKEKPKEPNLNNPENKKPTETQQPLTNKPKKAVEAVQNPENKNSEINNSENSRDSVVNSPKIKPSEEIKKSENSSKVNDNDEENELKNTEIIEKVSPKQEEKPSETIPVLANQQTAVYQTYKNYLDPNLGFENYKFKVKQKSENTFEKFYRINTLLNRKNWNFNEKSQVFTWNFSLNEIDDVLKTDPSHSNPYLWLFLDFKRHAWEISESSPTLIDKGTYSYWSNHFNKNIHENINKKQNAGIKFSLNEIKNKKVLEINDIDDVAIKIEYSLDNELIFSLKKKSSSTKLLTDNIYDAKANNKIFFSYFTSFINFSFTSENNQNQTLGKFELPEAYKHFDFADFFDKNEFLISQSNFPTKAYLFDPKKPFEVNVNSNDLSTKEDVDWKNVGNKKFKNTYTPTLSQVYGHNDTPLTEEMRIRTFFLGGTWTMFAKVKPSDPEDERYYVITNKHVLAAMGPATTFKKIGNSFFKNHKNVDFWYDIDTLTKKDDNFSIKHFWTISKTTKKDKLGNIDPDDIDVQVVIIDLKEIKQLIKQRILYYKLSVENWTSVLEDFEKWPTLPPLDFSDAYTNLYSDYGSFFVSFFMNGYGGLGYNNQIIHKAKYTKENNKGPEFTFEYNSDEYSQLMQGNSGSLIVDENGKIAAIYWGGTRIRPGVSFQKKRAYLLNSPKTDVIGANYGKYDPAKNINPNTLCHKIIQYSQKLPDKFEVISMCLPAGN